MGLFKVRNEVSNVIQNVACFHDKYDDNTNDYVPPLMCINQHNLLRRTLEPRLTLQNSVLY